MVVESLDRTSTRIPVPHSKHKWAHKVGPFVFGAGERVRTVDLNLGKVALYQLSYARTYFDLACKTLPNRWCEAAPIFHGAPKSLASIISLSRKRLISEKYGKHQRFLVTRGTFFQHTASGTVHHRWPGCAQVDHHRVQGHHRCDKEQVIACDVKI